MIGDFFLAEEFLKSARIRPPEKTGDGDVVSVVRQGRGDVDSFAAGVGADALDAIDRAGGKIRNRDRAIDRGIERDRDDLVFSGSGLHISLAR